MFGSNKARGRVVFFLGMAIANGGCGENHPPVPNENAQTAAPVGRVERRIPSGSPGAGPSRLLVGRPGEPMAGAAAVNDPASPTAPASGSSAPPSQLSDQLASQSSRLSNCAAMLPEGASAQVSVTAQVSATGRITRINAGGLTNPSAQRCIEQTLGASTLRYNGDPTSVTVDLNLGRQRVAVPAAPPDPNEPTIGPDFVPRAPGAAAPEVVLPARGAEGRPEGFVPPTSTLPALAD